MIPSGGTNSSITYTLKEGCEVTVSATTDNPSMITINSVGSGSINFTVSKNESAKERSGNIIPSVNGNSCESKKIKLEQAAGEAPTTCECTALTVQETASVLVGKTTDVPFTQGCTTNHSVSVSPSDGSVATAAINGTNITITGVKAGTATVTLTYDGDDSHKNCTKTITVTVTSDCDCDNLTINGRTDAIPAAGGENIQIGTYNSDTCLVSLGGTSDKDWVTNIKLENGKIIANIGEYTNTTENRTANITITGKTSTTATETCTKDAFTITQSKSATTCECSALTLSDTSVTINAGASTTVSFTADCTTNHSVRSSNENVATATINGTNITINGKTKGPATITLTYTASTKTDCTKTIDVEVKCPSITITPDSGSCESNGATVTFTHS